MTQGYRPPRDVAERFWEKVDRSGDCWVWIAHLHPAGYGVFGMGSRTDGTRRVSKAHHVAYELEIGAVPAGMHIHHRCENRACVRPDHLETVTPREHVYRHNGPTAINGRKTHCPKCGRPLSGDNLLFETGRRCKSCRLAYMSELKKRRRRERRSVQTGKGKPQ